MTLKIEGVVDRCVDEEKALRRFGRFESLQFPLAPPDRQMRVLRAIVGTQTLVMLPGETKIAKRRSVRPEPVGYDRSRRKSLPFHQLSQQPQSG
jgi:hypothetical protein